MAEKKTGQSRDPSDEESSVLRDYLVRLATDPAELGRFVKDPEASMEAAELPARDRVALKSGDPSAIYSRLTGAAAMPPVTVLVVDMQAAAEAADAMPRIRSMPAMTIFGGGQPVFP